MEPDALAVVEAIRSAGIELTCPEIADRLVWEQWRVGNALAAASKAGLLRNRARSRNGGTVRLWRRRTAAILADYPPGA